MKYYNLNHRCFLFCTDSVQQPLMWIQGQQGAVRRTMQTVGFSISRLQSGFVSSPLLTAELCAWAQDLFHVLITVRCLLSTLHLFIQFLVFNFPLSFLIPCVSQFLICCIPALLSLRSSLTSCIFSAVSFEEQLVAGELQVEHLCMFLLSCLGLQIGRLEGQVARYKNAAENAEKVEDELKAEKRKLQREVTDVGWFPFQLYNPFRLELLCLLPASSVFFVIFDYSF